MASIKTHPTLLSGLLAYYKLDGNANDAHTNVLNGTAIGTPTWPTALLKQGVQVNGSSQYINLGTDILLNPTALSISAWVYLAGTPSGLYSIVTKRTAFSTWADLQWAAAIDSARKVKFEVGLSDSTGITLLSASVLAVSTWYHVACVYDGTDARIYLNGYLNNVVAGAGAIHSKTYPCVIGARADGSTPWAGRADHLNGRFDEITLAARAWTPAEARDLYHTGYPLRYEEVVVGVGDTMDVENLSEQEQGYSFVPVTDFTAVTGAEQKQIILDWTNPVHPGFESVIVRRSKTGYPVSPGSGDLVYNGTGEGLEDNDLDIYELYYYSIFTYDIYHSYSIAVQDSARTLEEERAKFTNCVATAKDKVRATFDQIMRLGEGDGTDVLVPANWNFATLAHPVIAQSIALFQLDPTIIDITLDGEGTAGASYTATVAATVQAADLRTMDGASRSQVFTGLGEMPQLTLATSIGLFRVLVEFSEPVLGADDPDNYEIAGLVISSVHLHNETLHQYVLHTNQQTSEADYTVVASGITDLVGGPIDPDHDSFDFTGYMPSGSYASRPQDQGLIEALTGTIGEAATEMGGLISTKLSAVVAAGATVLPVETTEGWANSGKCAVEGVPYTYSGKTITTLTGIKYIRGGEEQTGAAMLHHIESVVTDISRERSYQDKLRRALLLDYAEEEDLNVIGRNFGLIRHPVFTEDDVYREVIRGMAYNPKGTMLGLELALTGMAGAGNFVVYEDLIRYPCQVFIQLTGDALIHSAQKGTGKAWMTDEYYDALRGTADTLDLSATPLFVYGVHLKALQEVFDFREDRPSDVVYPYYPGITPASAFTYAGALAEGTSVAVENGQTKLTAGSAGTVFYRMLDTQGARVTAESDWAVALLLSIPTAASLKVGELEQASVAVFDGACRISAGIESTLSFGLFATPGGGFLGATVTLARDTYYTVELRKAGDWVELHVNGQLISRVTYADFSGATTTEHRIELGIRGAPNSGMALWLKQLRASIQTLTDYWSGRGVDGSVATASPATLTSGGATHDFLAGDVGKPLRTYGSAAANAQGGNNNGRWRVATYVSATEVTLRGVEREDAQTSSGTPTKITVPLADSLGQFVYPDDLGKSIVISGSTHGKDGTYLITKLFDPDTDADYATEDISGTARAHTCQVAAATFVTEIGLTWELRPNFTTESGLNFEMNGAGSFSGTVLTLSNPLWKNDLILEILAIDEHASQMLLDPNCITLVNSEGPPPTYTYYPWYVVDPLGMLRKFVDQLTAAGVVPEYFIGDDLYGY